MVCGLLRDGKVNFHPSDDEKLMETDKVLFIAPLNWKKKQLTDIKTEDITVDQHVTRKQVFEKKRSRLAKIIMRPRKSLSKGSDSVRGPKESILLLGWRGDVVHMVEEFDNYLGPGSSLVCPYNHYLYSAVTDNYLFLHTGDIVGCSIRGKK